LIGAQDTLAAALYKQVKIMALNAKKYERIFSKTGSDADKISTDAFDEIKEDFDQNRYLEDASQFSMLGPVLYQLQQMQDELDDLRTEISSNKDKTTFPGLGTSSTTALAGDTTTITTTQANEITANTAKVSQNLRTANHTMQFDVVNTKGTYTLTITIIDATNAKAPVTKTVNLTLS
jgi:hypothetical protein